MRLRAGWSLYHHPSIAPIRLATSRASACTRHASKTHTCREVYPRTPRTDPCGVGQKQVAPGGPGGSARHQKFGVKQMVPGACGGTCAIAGLVLPKKAVQIAKTALDVRNQIMGPPIFGSCDLCDLLRAPS